MTMLEHDDDVFAERVRAALRQIAVDGLAAGAVPLRPRRHWIRPATIAAALVLVAALVAAVVALRADEEERTVVDGGTAPVRVIPAPIPEDMQVDRVQEVEPSTVEGLPRKAWARMEDGRIVALLMLHYGESLDGFQVPGARLSVTPTTGCGDVLLFGVNMAEDAFRAAADTVTCEPADHVATASEPDGFHELAPEQLAAGQWTITLLGGSRRAVVELRASAVPVDPAFFAGAQGFAVEQLADHDVVVSDDRTSFRWQIAPDIWGSITRGDLTDDEVAALIDGTRAVSEAEWQEWLATVPVDLRSDGPIEGSGTATTVAATSVPG
jgi:hypothetical protein